MQDQEELGIRPAESYPRASEHVDDMVRLADRLVAKGVAYEKLRSLYFAISRYPDYGRISGVDLNKIRLGATVDLDEYEKDNPRDFTLLKRSKLLELKRGIYTKTEWGNVRPSWHIQCAAISMKHLGESFDIHAAGREHVFPHHENVMAISGAATGKLLARYWAHCDRVLVDGKKVDESGSGLILADLKSLGYTGREIRHWLLSTHYRKPLLFSEDRLATAKRSLTRLDACLHSLQAVADGAVYPELDQLIYDIRQGFINAMDDDLNISMALASVFSVVKKVNRLVLENRIDPAGAARILDAFRKIDAVLHIFDFGNAMADPEIQRLVQQREAARAEKNWVLADQLREELASRGVEIRDRRVAG
jgi:cysteinyl-tRNA synthetase